MARKKKHEELNLTELQEAFVDAFLGEALFDPLKAYNLAGYAESMKPYNEAMRVLRSKAVAHHIHKRLAEQDTDYWINESAVVQRLWKEAIDESRGSSQAARINALVWVGKHLGMWQDKKDSQEDKQPIIQITNYGLDKQKVEKELNRPEVVEQKDKVSLPEGIVVANYAEEENVH